MKLLRVLVWIGLLACSLTVEIGNTRAQAPANDDFQNATVLPPEESVTVDGTTYDATVQPGETDASDTVWYAWTAPKSGLVAVSGVAQANPLQATIVIGNNLLLAKAIAQGVMTASPVAFYAVKGITYEIQISDYVPGYVNYNGFPFTLGLAITDGIPTTTKYVKPDINDDFDHPFVIGKSNVTFVQYMANTTLQPFELALLKSVGVEQSVGIGSTWISWTPKLSGTATFSAVTPDQESVLLIEGKGKSLATFKALAANDNAISFKCKAGEVYRLYIAASNSSQVLASLRVIPQ